MPKPTWSDQELITAVANSFTLADVCRTLHLKPVGGNYNTLNRAINRLELSTSHFLGRGWNTGPNRKGGSRIVLSEILNGNIPYTNSDRLRRRLIAEGIKDSCCETCGNTHWLGQPIPLHLEHMNGDHSDNRLENLMILCPNCHALTPTYCRRKSALMEEWKTRRS